ncbi:hypothetical protein KZA17_16915, partial [Pseudomonas syringae]|nr:hypothetical protein [Pseudomonas syringae]
SHGLKLELEGVFNAVCLGLSHVVSLRLLRHLARDTFFRGKVTPLLLSIAAGIGKKYLSSTADLRWSMSMLFRKLLERGFAGLPSIAEAATEGFSSP